MAEVSLNWCAVLLLLAIVLKSAVSSDTDVAVGELNNKLSDLQDRLNLFDYITKGKVTVLVHRVEFKDLPENVTVHMNESNRKLANLEDKIDALSLDVPKQDHLESKLNALAATVTSNMSSLLLQETNAKLDNLVAKVGSFASVDTRLNDLESKMSSLLERLEEKESKYDEYAKMHMNESNQKVANLEDKIDNRLTDLESKLNALAATVTNFVGNIEGTLLKPLSSCSDAFARPLFNRSSGVYNIQPIDTYSPFDVYCLADPKGGRPWTVVQRRVDGTVDFHRNWTEYQRGFGDLDGNLWIGLDKLHWLTTKGEPQELWVMLTDADGKSAHAYYDRFAIGNEAEKYPLAVLGEYSGDAGDPLKNHKSVKFSTYDNHNDFGGGICAEILKSAWWFKSNLNGVYGKNSWHWITFSENSLKYTHMAIRPARK